ncbi:hypothetical protein EUX98_g984 [Antrodiella citrinella]|uniref:Uncharacterized protein n=1 Tax=Antrodiella citrinella TaxID=2447956 RepID=A0A4S4N4Z0_9APHY|nr:hypothetical protein EUX98_g984 [Antrodiella citrinella]
MSLKVIGDDDGIPLSVKPERPSFPRTVSELNPNARNAVPLQAKKNTILKSHGRPPWYGEDGLPICDAFVVGIAGGSASGKTHVARQIVQKLGSIPTVVILSQDSFYKKHSPEEVILAHQNLVDFDHPDAIDMPMFAKCDSDLMLARRLRRDVKERGRTVDGTLDQYLRYVKPSYDNFVLPTARHANIIVPGSDNAVAIELIATHIRRQLKDRSTRFRQQMADAGPRQSLSVTPSGSSTPSSDDGEVCNHLIVLPQTPQLKGIYTILRDKETPRSDFIFFADRLATFISEKALEHLPYRPKTITTPIDLEYKGKELDTTYVCGVSILRSGGPLERGLRRVINDVPIGSLLIQSDATTGEPILLHLALPQCVRDRRLAEEAWVFLLDAQANRHRRGAFMAIRILLDHGVRQDHIIFVTFLVARKGGICVLRRAFPDVKVVCGAVDDGLRETWLEAIEEREGHTGAEARKVWVVEPGMGILVIDITCDRRLPFFTSIRHTSNFIGPTLMYDFSVLLQ